MKVGDYSAYMPSGAITRPWGVAATSTGHTRVPPGVAYPQGRHPDDHALSWTRGRVLHEYQVVYITEGEGRFESPEGRRRKVRAGTVFVLFPGVWHRYEPRRETGWVEHWIELTGPAVEQLERARIISPRNPFFPVGVRPELLELFGKCHNLARAMPRGFQPVLATLGLEILARVVHEAQVAQPASAATDDAVQQAQAIIAGAADRPLRMDDVAEAVNMSYSHFRRAFRERTGLPPKQYHMQLRMRRVKDLLTGSSMSVKQIADALGFDSPFHLSGQVKAFTGLSPTQWRAGVAGRPSGTGGTRAGRGNRKRAASRAGRRRLAR